jgi:exodeoxyribonuclease VII small subunit
MTATPLLLDRSFRERHGAPVSTDSAAERPTFEALMANLESIVERLESNELSLEEAIDAYQQGVRLAKQGHDRLSEAERRIEEVTRAGDTRPVDADRVLGSG